jgi:hypothetical protein
MPDVALHVHVNIYDYTGSVQNKTPSKACTIALTSNTLNRIGDALPIVPFTLRNERIQRCHYFLFAEVRDQFFKLQLNLGESSGCEVARGSHSSRR